MRQYTTEERVRSRCFGPAVQLRRDLAVVFHRMDGCKGLVYDPRYESYGILPLHVEQIVLSPS